MHELSLCRSIHAVVDRARAGRTVRTVGLQIGQLRQVVPETLRSCWSLVTEGGPLSGSCLEIDHVPVVLACQACGERTEVVQVLVLRCARCSSDDVSLISGQEFLVTCLDLAAPTPDHEQ